MNLQERGIIKCGTLTKSPPMDTKTRRRWHARYFVLYDPARIQRDTMEHARGSFQRTPSFSARASRCLQRRNTIEEPSFLSLMYFKDEDAKKKGLVPINTITLEGATVEENAEPIRGHKYVINLNTETRVYHLCASTEEDHKSWLQALKKTLSRNEPVTPTNSGTATVSTFSKKYQIEEVPPEENSMIQQLIEWKRERMLMEQQSKEEQENSETMWLENKMMADLNETDDDKKKDSGFSEKYGLYNSNNDVNETENSRRSCESEEAFQDRIHRLSLESMQERSTTDRFSRSRTLQKAHTINCYENVGNPEFVTEYHNTKSKAGRSRSVENSAQYFKNIGQFRDSSELCESDIVGNNRPFSTPDNNSYTSNDINIISRQTLPWQRAISDDGFEEERSEEDEPPELPEKTYTKRTSLPNNETSNVMVGDITSS